MSEKHDPEITPLPAPLPGLSIEIEAVQSDIDLPGVIQRKKPEKAAKHAAPAPAPIPEPAPTPAPVAEAADEKEKTDPELAPVPPPPPSRAKLWWIIGGLGLFALGVGSGSLIWQPSVSLSTTPPVVAPPQALPSVPSPPVEVTPIVPPPPSTTATATPPTVTPTPTPTVTPLPTQPEATPPPVAAQPPQNVLPVIPTRPTAPPPTTPTPPPEATPTPVAPPPPSDPNTVAAKTTPTAPATPKAPRVKAPKAPTAPVVKAPEAPPPVVAPPPPPIPTGPQKTLAQSTIRQIMMNSESGWRSCVKDAFGSNLTISIGVSAAGQVQKADILGPLAQSSTGRCVTGEIKKLHFPPFTEGGASKQFFWSYQIPAN